MTVRRLVATLLLVVPLSLLAAPAPGWARDETIVATVPADGAVLAAPPTEVVLTTAGQPDAGLSHLSVRSDRGATVEAGKVRGEPDSLGLPIRVTEPGSYTAEYHVVLTDGRESIGAMRFSVGTGVAPPVLGAVAHDHGVDPLGATLLMIDFAVLFAAVLMLRLRPAPRRDRERPAYGEGPRPDRPDDS
jgi:methionine-rich copper-binding protein CopC